MGHGLMTPTQVPLDGAPYDTTIAFSYPLLHEFCLQVTIILKYLE